MEDRQAQPAREADPPVLQQLLGHLANRVSGTERPLVEAFARELFGKATALLLESADTAWAVDLALDGFRFVFLRGNRPIVVRVFAPTRPGSGAEAATAVVETILDDRPFIVDTVCEVIRREGGEIRLLLHPLLGVQRNDQGALLHVTPPEASPGHESFVHAEVALLDPGPELQRKLADHLAQVDRVTGDYRAMRDRLADVATALASSAPASQAEEAEEAAAFLGWMAQKSFVYLGFQEYGVGAEGALARVGEGLGILHGAEGRRYDADRASADDVRGRFRSASLVSIRKTPMLSPVHRIVPMDDIGIAKRAPDGSVVGEWRLLGLFTSKAYFEPAEDIPVLRRLLAALLEREGAVEDSHDYKDLVSIFNSIPKEQLFGSRLADLHALVREIGAARADGAIHVACHPDALDEHLFVTILLPRARFSTQLSEKIEALLGANFRASVLDQHLALDERPTARLHFSLSVPAAIRAAPPVEVTARQLNDLLRTWDDELHEHLGRIHSPGLADRLAAKYREAFPASYRAAMNVADAARDIECLEALARTGEAQIEIAAEARGAGRATLRLYLSNESLILSDFVPVLENLGLRVFGEDFVDLQHSEPPAVRIHTYFLRVADAALDVDAAAPALVDALRSLRAGRIENDRLNGLVLRAGLDWRAVEVVRTYVEQARQAGVASRATLIDALVENPAAARALHGMFAARFDPAGPTADPQKRLAGAFAAAQREFLAGLDAVESLVHDRILRALAATIEATVRTNFYRQGLEEPEAQSIAIKIDAARLAHLPAPRPMYETYVHAPFVEGVHLRAGRVARGGIRLSDRPDDFRSEVLGLMRTQVIKNAVIVPVGAKGGFVVKQRGGAESVERAYRAFVGALLSVTDGIERGRVVPPLGQIAYDPPDPYLVIAADKGTASFSDVANEIAARYRFWLGDAFASGGAHGYDHKKLGITARGAWECARQHFRELGRDIEREPVTVIGIGDMSGDVFGNGMLRARTIRLLAAFDHRHVFLDPDPDPDRSFWERDRLFHLPHSSWEDYAANCLSPGGGVFRRNAKSIPLSAQVRAMLGVDADALPGEEVVRAILRAEADLLWNGGIGTYVKAGDEPHAEVGDPANDAVRVNAGELRVRVVAEGGNLGFTQRARIEFALAGGRIHSDAIDNSGGVDCSDHEVNLKIALQPAVAAHEISAEERNRILAAVADEVCDAVLEHNRRQALALSLDQTRSRTMLAEFRDLMAAREADGALDRGREHLPSRDALRARRSVYRGLTRPELAVLLAYTKLDLQRRVLDSPLSEDEQLDLFLRAYFPRPINERFPHAVRDHPLRQEITAVEVANRVVDSMGMTFVNRCARDTGRDVAEIIKAWTVAVLVSSAEATWRNVAARRADLSAEAEQACLFRIERSLEIATKWVIDTQPPDVPLARLVDRFRAPVAELLAAWPALLTGGAAEALGAETDGLSALGVDAALAEELARLASVGDALEVTEIGRRLDARTRQVAEAYLRVVDIVDVDWVRRTLPATVSGEARWERRAVGGLIEGLMYARRQLTVNVLRAGGDSAPVGERLESYVERSAAQIERLRALIDDLRAAPQPTLAGMLVVMRELGRLSRNLSDGTLA
jgi:glutamate dehydrogenase